MESLSLYQIIVAALTVIAALNVLLAKNPVVSAMSLMATLFMTGALYFGLGAFFIGAVQVLIYAGAISVLFVFIVMLLDMRPSLVAIPGRTLKVTLMSLAGLVFAAGLGLVVCGAPLQSMTEGDPATASTSLSIAARFLSRYMLPFEVTGLLIFAAVMGAILIGRAHDPSLRQARKDAK